MIKLDMNQWSRSLLNEVPENPKIQLLGVPRLEPLSQQSLRNGTPIQDINISTNRLKINNVLVVISIHETK